MHELYDLKEKLIKELADYAENGKFSEDDAENIKNLAGAVDHICNIVMDYEEEYSNTYGGNSYARGGNRGGRSSYRGGGYEDGNSYARGRGRNARRDSMGRYSREGGYSYDDAKDDMIVELKELMHDAPDERIKQEFKRFIDKVDSM